MKFSFLLFLMLTLAGGLVQAQKKSAGKNPPAPKTAVAPQRTNDSGFQSQSHDLLSAEMEKLPVARPGMLRDSLLPFLKGLSPKVTVLENPVIILAPAEENSADAQSFKLMSEELKSTEAALINSSERPVLLALAVYSAEAIKRICGRKEFLNLNAYCFSSPSSLERCSDPYVRYIRNLHSLDKLIFLQNEAYFSRPESMK